MAVEIDMLESIALFSDLNSQELEQVSALFSPMKVSEGETLTQKGRPATLFYIILSGNFMIYFDQNRAITIHDRGNIIGWSTVVTPFQYTGTAVALTDGEVLSASGEAFFTMLMGDSSLGEKIMKKINAIIADRLPYVKGFPEEKED